MEARGTGPVTEWVVEEDARLISPPPGAVCERSISSCRVGATARGRAPGTESPLLSPPVRDASRRRRPPGRRGDGTRPGGRDGVSSPLAPSQGCEQETTSAETTGGRHEAGRRSVFSLPLSLPVRDASRGRRWRYHEGTKGTNEPGVFWAGQTLSRVPREWFPTDRARGSSVKLVTNL